MLRLVKISREYEMQLIEMMDEWTKTNEKIVPYVIRKNDYKDFNNYIKGIEDEEKGLPGLVPSTTYFCLDDERNIFIGAVNIRHYLNDKLLKSGGHIGDGIRPSERNKGFATQMISMALEKCREMGMKRVLMVCDKSNCASARTIVKNGGELENKIWNQGKIVLRYWIEL